MLVKLLSAAAVLAAPGLAANLRAGNKESAPAATQLANEVTHDLEMNYNKIAPFGEFFMGLLRLFLLS